MISAAVRRCTIAAGVLLVGVTSAATPNTDLPARDPVRLTVAATGNTVRYRVREQLARRDLPNDAVGETSAIRGAITLDDDGQVVPASSEFVIDIASLKSDSDRRDGYVRRRTLETEQHPTVTLRPTAVRGLAWPLPASGRDEFELVGDLTIRGVTRPTTWRGTAAFDANAVTGTVATAFTFDDFQIAQPSVAIVLSVADTIRLEYDFRLMR